MNINVGFASIDFTPEPGLPLLGQMHERISTHTRDPLFACAVAFEGNGEAAIIVAADVCILDNMFVAAVQQAWAERSGLGPRSLLLHATHTHVAPVSSGTLIDKALPEFEARLQAAILEAAAQAWEGRRPAQLFAATGYLEHLGWNRRAMFEDGTSRMYANASVPGFMGLEGPRDGAVPALWARDAEEGKIIGVLTGFASHPNCLESEHFYSADLPGETRKHLGAALGGVPVVYLTGAAGNTAPSVLEKPNEEFRWRGERGVVRSGQLLAGEVLKLIAEHDDPIAQPAVTVAHTTIDVARREWPAEVDASYPSPLVEEAWREARPYYESARDRWPALMTEAGTVPLNLNVLRLGDVAICTNPAELFVEFGLDIKADSPARVTFVSELTDGWCGYVPTRKAFSRGGYETWCAPSSGLCFEAGEQIVEATRGLLNEAFDS